MVTTNMNYDFLGQELPDEILRSQSIDQVDYSDNSSDTSELSQNSEYNRALFAEFDIVEIDNLFNDEIVSAPDSGISSTPFEGLNVVIGEQPTVAELVDDIIENLEMVRIQQEQSFIPEIVEHGPGSIEEPRWTDIRRILGDDQAICITEWSSRDAILVVIALLGYGDLVNRFMQITDFSRDVFYRDGSVMNLNSTQVILSDGVIGDFEVYLEIVTSQESNGEINIRITMYPDQTFTGRPIWVVIAQRTDNGFLVGVEENPGPANEDFIMRYYKNMDSFRCVSSSRKQRQAKSISHVLTQKRKERDSTIAINKSRSLKYSDFEPQGLLDFGINSDAKEFLQNIVSQLQGTFPSKVMLEIDFVGSFERTVAKIAAFLAEVTGPLKDLILYTFTLLRSVLSDQFAKLISFFLEKTCGDEEDKFIDNYL